MESGKRTALALLITIVILLAVFSSFGRILFQGGTPQVVLPTASLSDTESVGPGGTQGTGGELVIEVTPETVQSVIAGLARPDSYYREMTLETFWGEDSSAVTSAQVWADGGYLRVDSKLADGRVEHTIVGDGQRYRWYDNERGYFTTAAREEDADLVQRIPTYEDILELDVGEISNAGYERKDGVDCVYVEVQEDTLGYRERYWVSVEWGLLVAAETVKDEQIVLRSSADSVEIPVRADNAFTLPNGTQLHEN